MKTIFAFIVCSILFFAAYGADADTIYLKSGRIVHGRIIKETPIFIRVETDEAVTRQEFLQSDVKDVEHGVFLPSAKTAAPPSVLKSVEENPMPAPEILRFYGESPSSDNYGEQGTAAFSQENVPQAREDVFAGNISIIRGEIGWGVFGLILISMLYLGFGQRRKKPLAEGEGSREPKNILPITRLIGLSVRRTKMIVFQPFQLKKWLPLLFIACMSGSLFSGGLNYSFNPGGWTPKKAHAANTETVSREDQAVRQVPSQGVKQFWGSLSKHPVTKLFSSSLKGERLPIVIMSATVFLLVGFILLFTWLSARFRFIWYDAIVRNDASIKEPFRRFKRQGNSLFKLYLFMSVLFALGIAAFFVWIIFAAGNVSMGWDHVLQWPFKTWFNVFAPILLSGLMLFLFSVIVFVFIHEFVIPIMVLEETTFIPAWRQFLGIYRSQTKRFWIYLIVSFGLSVLISLIAVILAMAAALTLLVVGGIVTGLLYFLFVFLLKTNFLFAVIVFIIGIPSLIVSILMFLSIGLPFAVFFRNFSLYFFGNLPCGYAPLLLKMERKQNVLMIIGAVLCAGALNAAGADEIKPYLMEDEGSVTLTQKAWEALKEKDLERVLFYTNKCVDLYGSRAALMQGQLTHYPADNAEIHRYWALNDVATAYFIQAEAYRKAGDSEKAREAYKTVVEKYSFGQCWDPKGWFWKPAEAAADAMAMIDKGLDLDFEDYRSVTLVVKAWNALDEESLEEVFVYTNKCIKLYSQEAAKMQNILKGYPGGSDEEIFAYWALNDVATAYYIQGEAYRKRAETAKAREAYQKIIDEFSYGQCWDPRGWFWKPAEAAANRLNVLEEDKKRSDE